MTEGADAIDISLALRPVRGPDISRLVELNNDAAPAVPLETQESMAALLEVSAWAALVEGPEHKPIAAVITVATGADYASENYEYFERRFNHHLYIDRVFVDRDHRSAGIGKMLYRAVEDEARRRGATVVTCEVNLEPPNPKSLAFHHREGFQDLDTQATKGGSVVVQLLAKEIST